MDSQTAVLVLDVAGRPTTTWEKISEIAGTGPVTLVHSPREAELALARGNFGLMFCSYQLGELTGTDFVTHLREQGVETHAIIISEQFDTRGVIEAARIRATDFLPAPFNIADLHQRLALLFGPQPAAAR